MKHSVLTVSKLKKRFKKRTVVKDVSLNIESGEVVGLLGPNGAGKTTSFYMIVGLIGADDGDIRLDEQSITHYPIHQRAQLGLGYLPQEASIFRRMTVEENITAILEISGLKGKELEKELDLLLDDLNIGHLRDSNALALSGGERRRVEIARVLATRPRFILLDEPFAGASATAPTSSATARCWPPASRRSWSTTTRCARFTLANTSTCKP
jgi:lipopolysaccharide export system ATP-binding protein